MSSQQFQSYKGIFPTVGDGCCVHPAATVIGEVTLGDNVSIWPGVVIRGDVNRIVVGNNVTVGHSVVLHGCTIGDECLIGIGTIILDRAVIEPQVMIGAGSLISPGKVLKSGYLYMGSPAKEVRLLTPEEIANFTYSAQHYCRLKNEYLRENQ